MFRPWVCPFLTVAVLVLLSAPLAPESVPLLLFLWFATRFVGARAAGGLTSACNFTFLAS
jgi:hypothetical protein